MASTDVAAGEQLSYEDLYARWERGNWSAMDLDFTEDRRQWHEEMTEFERRAALWNYSLFFYGEDAVTDGLSPYIDAAPLEEQKYFLATQQVDEARHAVLFGRFMREVVGVDGGSQGALLEAIQPQLTWGLRRVFRRLEKMCDELRRDRSRPRLAAAVTLYHLVIEASLAQPGQHFIQNYLDERRLLPAFRAGLENVARDEQRHIGFGVKLLSDLVAEDPACRGAVAELLREVMPWTVPVMWPPGGDRRYTEVFDFTLEEIGTYGARSLERKLAAAGLAVETLPGAPPWPAGLDAEQRSKRGIDLMEAGVLGPKEAARPEADEQSMALVFDTIRRSVDPAHGLPEPTTLQWEFTDAEPWHLRIDNGSTAVAPGRASDPAVTFRCRWEDWVDVVGGRSDPRHLVLRGRLRPRGNLRLVLRASSLFGR